MSIGGISIKDEHGFLSDEEFVRAFSGTVSRLNDLLGTAYCNVGYKHSDPLGTLILGTINLNKKRNHFLRDWEAHRIGCYAMDLDLIKEKRCNDFITFRKLHRKVKQNEFFGLRLEVNLTANLIRKGIDFDKRESPDFEIRLSNSKGFAECMSTNIQSKPSRKPLYYKLASAIRSKGLKPYSNQSTVLFVDFTNVLYTAYLLKQTMNRDELRSSIQASFNTTSFGGVMATALIADLDNKKFITVGEKIISQNADPFISSFLDEFLGDGAEEDIRYCVPHSL